MSSVKKNFVALYISQSYWIVSKGYRLYKYNPEKDKLTFFSRLVDSKNAFLSRFRLLRRLFRAEITNFYHFKDDTWMCIAKKAIFKYNKNSGLFEKCCSIEKGSKPMVLCQANDGTIYYGEYCFNPERMPMRIMQSKDNGETWSVAWTFGDGEVNHIHGVFNDPYTGRIWVATGDDDCACILGYTEDGFRTFVRKYEGSQQFRVCVPMFTENSIIYATDSQYAQNVIRLIDRETGEVRNICEIQGSGIYATQWGNCFVVSTTVEPSKVNLEQNAHLWFSKDGKKWVDVCSFKKDIWKKTYFQFGTLRLPHYESDSDYLIFSGRSVKGLDQKTMIIPIEDIE